MPKDLFYTISADKRQKIYDASMEEFSTRLFNEASINQIIKKADISRGSFYQYFNDKEDLYFYILENIIKSTAYPFVQKHIETKPISVLSVYRELFIHNLKMMSDKKYKAFFKRMYMSMNYEFQQKSKMIFSKIRKDMFSGKDGNRIKELGYDQEYLLQLSNILELISRDLLTMKIANDLDDEYIIGIYDLRIELLCIFKDIVNNA